MPLTGSPRLPQRAHPHAQIYLFSEISGASFNPAVTMTQFFIGKLGAGNKDWKRLLTYFGVQVR